MDEIQQRSQHFASACRDAKSGNYPQTLKDEAIRFVEDELLSMLRSADKATVAKLLELRDTVLNPPLVAEDFLTDTKHVPAKEAKA